MTEYFVTIDGGPVVSVEAKSKTEAVAKAIGERNCVPAITVLVVQKGSETIWEYEASTNLIVVCKDYMPLHPGKELIRD